MKIAIVKLSALGDIIHAMVALQFIKKHLPNATIDWVVEEGFKDILCNNPDIHQIHTVNLKQAKQEKSFKSLFQELIKVRKFDRYDLVIDAQGLVKSAIIAKLIPSKQTWGFSKNSIRESLASYFYSSTVDIAYDQNTIDRNVAIMCEPLGFKVLHDEIVAKTPFLYFRDNAVNFNPPYTVLIAGSTWGNRNYPKEKFVDLANILKIKCLVPWGSAEEKITALWMSEHSKYIEILPKLSLDELKQVISKSVLLIGNDTGPTHMAWGLNIPSITVFGPTPINRVYQTPINRVISSNSRVDHFKLNKKDDSIKSIKVTDIAKIAKELLNKGKK